MAYESLATDALRTEARQRKIARNGMSGKTSWIATATRDALVAALTAADAGVPLPLESADGDAHDAAAMLVEALQALTQGKGVDEARVREIARDEAGRVIGVTVTVRRLDASHVEVGRTHEVYTRVLDIVSNGLVPYLVGPPGSGKTYLASQVGTALALRLHADSFNEQMPEYRISGYRNATGDFVETPFYRAVTEPGLYLGDEIDKANANVTGTLNMALSNGHASFAIGLVQRHEGARFMFAGNTSGFGATPQYPDRTVLPADLRDRFVFVPMPVDMALERALALAANPKAGDWVDFVQSIRARVDAASIPLVVSPRASVNGAKLLALGWSRADVEAAALWRMAPASVVKRARGES